VCVKEDGGCVGGNCRLLLCISYKLLLGGGGNDVGGCWLNWLSKILLLFPILSFTFGGRGGADGFISICSNEETKSWTFGTELLLLGAEGNNWSGSLSDEVGGPVDITELDDAGAEGNWSTFEATLWLFSSDSGCCKAGSPPGGPGTGVRPSFNAFNISIVFHFAYFILFSICLKK